METLKGVVRQTEGGVYTVALVDGRTVEATLRKRLKREARTGERVVIGDRVEVAEAADDSWAVERVLPRETEIVRQAPNRRKAKVVAANVDRLLAVVAARRPDPNRDVLDRILVIAEANEVDPYLVVNKLDLEGAEEVADELARSYRKVGYRVILTSAETGRGLDELRELLCRGTSALVGPSGVGKSHLLNAVQPGLDLRTGELSRKPGRGRHTTVTARLIELDCGGLVADTPGFSDVGLWGVDPNALDTCFPEFRPFVGECRFRGCSHLHEPDCAVQEAVEDGRVDEGRYRRYRRFVEEAAEQQRPDWE